jgi:hypothetical protein
MGHHQKFSRTLFNVGNSSGFVFLFHQFEIQDATSNTIDDALYACVDFIQSPDSAENSIVFSFHDSSEDSSNMHDKPLKQDTFLIMQRITFINQWSLLSLDEMQILKQNGIAPRRRRFIQFGSCRSRLVSNTSESTPHLTLAILTGVMLAVVLGILGTLATVRFTSQCPLSIGPPHQLDYTQFNITEWAKSNINNDTQWAIRFDDQALIPAHLYTDEEAYYQMWYRNRYKEQALLVSEEAHLNETWLYSNESYVPADTQFHISHCVLTLRRYWIARETGHHICSWDLDHGHIHHCLETLDNLIFDDNPRQVRDNSSLHWNTKLCY